MQRCLSIVLVISSLACFAQPDTLINIQFPSGLETVVVLKPTPNANSRTTPYVGMLPHNQFSEEVPVLNVMDNSSFTIPSVGEKNLDVTAYPASTTVQMVVYKNGKPTSQCTGNMVSPAMAISAAHCILSTADKTLDADEIIVSPSGLNLINGARLLSKANSAYVLKKYRDGLGGGDIMLLELSDPIGDHTGWIGLSAVDTAIIARTLFHKFSYPARHYDEDPDRKGRQLHYNYGKIEMLPNGLLGINSTSATATPGQSGSSILNIEDGAAYSVGLSIYARNYQHQPLTKEIIAAFKPAIDKNIADANSQPFVLYPNPIRQSAALKLVARVERYTLVILNSKGVVVRTQQGSDTELIFIDKGTLKPGDYLFRLVDGKGAVTRGAFIVE